MVLGICTGPSEFASIKESPQACCALALNNSEQSCLVRRATASGRVKKKHLTWLETTGVNCVPRKFGRFLAAAFVYASRCCPCRILSPSWRATWCSLDGFMEWNFCIRKPISSAIPAENLMLSTPIDIRHYAPFRAR